MTPNATTRLGNKALSFMVLQKTIGGAFIFIIGVVAFFARHAANNYAQELINTQEPTAIGAFELSVGLMLLGLVVALIGALVAYLEYSHHTFALEQFDLRVREGILNLREISIPYRQMQNVNIERSLFYRFFGLSRVIIESAGNEESNDGNETDIVFDPMEKDLAEELRVTLQQKIGVQVVSTQTKTV